MTENQRVYFILDVDDWHARPNEGLWTEPSTLAEDAYVLMNTPFFVRDVSFLDIVRARPRTDGPGLEFIEVLARGGHSTHWLLVSAGEPSFDTYWALFQELGCSYESKTMNTVEGEKTLYALDVPETADIAGVRNLIRIGYGKGIWLWQEGHNGHDGSPMPMPVPN